MTIETREAPSGLARQLAAALQDIAPAPLDVRVLAEREQQFSKPLPVYVIGLEDAARGEIPEAAAMVGWRYLIVGPTSVATADIDMPGSGGEPAFNKLSEGANAERLSDALGVADANFGRSGAGYEARLLELPALNIGAVWLSGAQGDVFIPYLDEARLGGRAPAIEADFKTAVQAAAKKQVELLGRTLERP
jgi:hypothetical protein